MRGYRFYEEFNSSYKKRHQWGSGNILALELENGRPMYGTTGLMGCTAAVYDCPNSAIAGTQVSRECLRLKYKRVSEKRARAVHPRLFSWLDSFDA